MRPPSYSARPKFDIALHSPTDRPRQRTPAATEWFASYQYLAVPISTLSQARSHASGLLLCEIPFLRLRSGEPPFRVNDAAPDSASSWAVRSAASQAGIFLRSICSLWCYGILCKHVLPLSPVSSSLGYGWAGSLLPGWCHTLMVFAGFRVIHLVCARVRWHSWARPLG